MPTKTMSEAPLQEKQPDLDGHQAEQTNSPQNGHALASALTLNLMPPPPDRAHLPTFPLEVGWREVYDPKTKQYGRAPLTLLDIHYPTEDDVGVIFMAQGLLHDFWCVLLASLARAYLDVKGWFTLHDVLIYWAQASATTTAPDLAIFRGSIERDGEKESYHVGRDGPVPTFIIEITSKRTRSADLHTKPTLYAAVGVQEYLIIDIQTRAKDDWRLLGYRLEKGHPEYRKIKPDAEGGLTFESVNLRFVAVKRSQIQVYDAITGERLLTLDEQRSRADFAEQRAETAEQRAETAEQRAETAEHRAETAEQRAKTAEQRVQQEAAARRMAEEAKAALAAEIAQLRSQLGQQSSDADT